MRIPEKHIIFFLSFGDHNNIRDFADCHLDVDWEQHNETVPVGWRSCIGTPNRQGFEEDPELFQLNKCCLCICSYSVHSGWVMFNCCRIAHPFKMGEMKLQRNILN